MLAQVGASGVLARFERSGDAVSAATRTPLAELQRRGPARTLFLRAARTLTTAGTRELGDLVGVTHVAVVAVQPALDDDVRRVARVLGDPRFPSLDDGLLRWRLG